MRRAIVLLIVVLALAGAAAALLTVWPIGREVQLAQREGNADRGAYLARMAGCIACHTDSRNGGAPLAGGLALPTDFGTLYSPNLTTDAGTGIGAWTVEDFARAVRQGVSPDGEPYYPAFPYPFYSTLSDQDIADLWAAFQTVPAVEQSSKPAEMRFPFGFRGALKVWRALFFDAAPFQPEPQRSKAWNRGKFIVRGPAHCGACHTPRNFLGARQVEESLHGAEGLPGGDIAPPIDTKSLRENGWTEDNLAYALRSGVMPDGDTFGGSMAEVVRDGTGFLSDADLQAMAEYLLAQD